jgi:large conductance mechanosensitive channel
MFKEFRKFILRGNVVDLAVGLVVGAAFTSVVNSLVKGVINPLIAILYGGTKLADLRYSVSGQTFSYGDVINSAITFLIVAAVVFFFVVQPINKLTERFISGKETPEDATKKCPFCLSAIPKQATRCKFCTSKLESDKPN